MKQLLLFISILFCFQLGKAQQVDLIVSGLHVTADSNHLIPGGVESSLAISIQNADSTIVESGDTIYFSMGVNGTIYDGMEVLSSPLNPGEELYHNFGDSNLYEFADTGITYLVYGAVMYANDTVDSNDLTIDTFLTTVFVSNNWITDSFQVVDPSNLDGFDIDNGTNVPPNISEAEISFRNDGGVTYLQYSTFNYRIYLGNESVNVKANLYQSDVGPGEMSVRNVTNQALFPSTPDSIGNYSICAEVTEPVSNGGAGCFDFEIVDNWDPNDPDNWPHGIQNVERAFYNFTNASDFIGFSSVGSQLDITIYGLQGQRADQFSISSDQQISTSKYDSGIYLIEISSNGKVVGNEKFLRF